MTSVANIKLSLKATFSQRGTQKQLESQGSIFPTKSESTVLGSVEGDDKSLVTENQSELDDDDSSMRSTLSIVIRSTAECEAHDISLGQKKAPSSGKGTISSPRSYNSSHLHKNVDEFASSSNVSSKKIKEPKLPVEVCRKAMLGDRVTAKVYQIREHGLVLEINGGLRGMYKFEENGRRDFVVGNEVQVECSSFSTKGIPVYLLCWKTSNFTSKTLIFQTNQIKGCRWNFWPINPSVDESSLGRRPAQVQQQI